jgi:cysteinyl-tRNA synthetase
MLKLYNTMARKEEVFKPRGGDREVKIFTCGPSIYRRPHIGNYRTFLYEDILVRYLEFIGYEVDRVINFTDVEDKMITEAESRKKRVEEITETVSRHFHEETELLKIKRPSTIARSSTSVQEAAKLIKELIDRGFAYWYRGDVFFDPAKVEGFGKLFRLDMSRWPKKKVRFRKDTYTGNRWNLGDFILWHGAKDGDTVVWDTVLGKGRPSWNVQDPAMIVKHLGPVVDINCGGIDNIYRHHDYNIAIMESLSGREYSKFYLHGEHLLVDGKPMSKSRGNILYPEDVIKADVEARHLRFFLIYTYYRKKLNYNRKNFRRTRDLLNGFRSTVKSLLETDSDQENSRVNDLVSQIIPAFKESMDNDLRVGQAFDRIFAILKKLEALQEQGEFGRKAAETLNQSLRDIDTVMAVIFIER